MCGVHRHDGAPGVPERKATTVLPAAGEVQDALALPASPTMTTPRGGGSDDDVVNAGDAADADSPGRGGLGGAGRHGDQRHVVTFAQVWAMQHPRRRRVEPRTAALSRVWR